MNYVTNTEELTSIADAIREKGGTSAPLEYPEEYVSAIEAISGGGDDATAIIDRTISGTYINNKVRIIGDYAFHSCASLKDASFQNATNINIEAFYRCSGMETFTAPMCNTVSRQAFAECVNLKDVNLSKCTRVQSSVFLSCRNLETINLDSCDEIWEYIFSGCSSLSTISLPAITSFGSNVFRGCVRLVSLYLMGSVIPTFSTGLFASTPISNYSTVAGRYGNIFVPTALYDDYLVASGWSAYSARFVSV